MRYWPDQVRAVSNRSINQSDLFREGRYQGLNWRLTVGVDVWCLPIDNIIKTFRVSSSFSMVFDLGLALL